MNTRDFPPVERHRPTPRLSALPECRSCSGTTLTDFLDLGLQPIANALLDVAQLGDTEPRFPLELAFCHDCGLVQVTETLPPDILFGHDYPYFSSFSPALLAHSRKHCEQILRERALSADTSLVVEVASNDGYLLGNFVDAGIPVLGIDPAAGPVAAARRRGVPTLQAFFGAEVARSLAAEGKRADVMIANNVAAHVGSINDFIEGFAILLKDDGFARLEVAYLRDMIEKCEFDTVYHEHLFYWSVGALDRLTSRHGLYLNDAERLPIHGGSIRVTMSRMRGRSTRLAGLLAEEATLGMDDLAYYLSFAGRVEQLKLVLHDSVRKMRSMGARLAAYGAAAKGATLLNYMDFGPEVVEYVVDRNPAKIGKYIPGVRTPILPVEALTRDRPDYVLILAWNFAAEIMQQNREYAELGGQFILPAAERPSL